VIAAHVHDALRQVRELKLRVLDSQMFTGYSGRVRAVAGTVALAAAAVMSRPGFPLTVQAHLVGWGLVLLVAVVANYAALIVWFITTSGPRRDVRRLMPTVDALPALAVGAILSFVLVRDGVVDLLPGTWMCLYGLTNLASRRVLPRAIWLVGLYYVSCGVMWFVTPGLTFTNPWPMGIVFCVGEVAGGFIFHRNRMPNDSIQGFIAGKDRS
jgi:hypothetical protein